MTVTPPEFAGRLQTLRAECEEPEQAEMVWQNATPCSLRNLTTIFATILKRAKESGNPKSEGKKNDPAVFVIPLGLQLPQYITSPTWPTII